MHRFHLPPDQCQGSVLTLREEEAHHALHVLRLQSGDPVVVLDGEGSRLDCRVSTLAKRTVELQVVRREVVSPLPFRLTLVQAIPKGKTFDTIVQKATELGAHRVVPLISDRVVSRPEEAQGPGKVEHWRRIAIESIKQCGSPWLPRIELPVGLADFLSRKEFFDLALVASLQDDSQHPQVPFRSFLAKQGRRPENVCVWVGPEGDFSPAEYAAIQAVGALPITLGPLVLRADTAAIYCLSVASCELLSKPDRLT
jgi:16S rRNA (uracil1498-N3)-methyltransferase